MNTIVMCIKVFLVGLSVLIAGGMWMLLVLACVRGVADALYRDNLPKTIAWGISTLLLVSPVIMAIGAATLGY